MAAVEGKGRERSWHHLIILTSHAVLVLHRSFSVGEYASVLTRRFEQSKLQGVRGYTAVHRVNTTSWIKCVLLSSPLAVWKPEKCVHAPTHLPRTHRTRLVVMSSTLVIARPSCNNQLDGDVRMNSVDALQQSWFRYCIRGWRDNVPRPSYIERPS